MPSRPLPRSPTRRSALGLLGLVPLAALGAPLAGCGALPALEDVRVDPDWPGTAPPPVPDADELARRDAVAAARALRGAASELAPSPAETAALALVADACAVHLQQLGEPVGADEEGGGAPTGSPSVATPAHEPPSAAVVLDGLVAAARSARSAVPGTSGGLARLLASVAASRALLAGAVAVAAQLPAPAVPEPLPAPAGGRASGTGGATATPAPEAGALADVVAGALAASRAAEVAAASLGEDARDRALALRDDLAREAQALADALAAAGAAAPVPAPGYALPGPVTDAQDAVGLVVLVLDRLAATALGAVPALEGGRRLLAADVLARAAAAAAAWRPGPLDAGVAALPGTTAP